MLPPFQTSERTTDRGNGLTFEVSLVLEQTSIVPLILLRTDGEETQETMEAETLKFTKTEFLRRDSRK